MPGILNELATGINYFFAVLPDVNARADIVSIDERFRKSHRVNGSSVSADSLHLNLCAMGSAERLKQPLEASLLAAAAQVQCPGFQVSLDSAMRFTVQNGQFPFALCADAGTARAALELRKAIATAQMEVGLRVAAVSSFVPHVTLQYGHQIDALEESIPTIHWRADEFVLVRTFFDQSRHEVVGRWPLLPVQQGPPLDLLEEMANLPDLPEWLGEP